MSVPMLSKATICSVRVGWVCLIAVIPVTPSGSANAMYNFCLRNKHHLARFNNIAMQVTARRAADKEAVGLLRVHMYKSKCIRPSNSLFCSQNMLILLECTQSADNLFDSLGVLDSTTQNTRLWSTLSVLRLSVSSTTHQHINSQNENRASINSSNIHTIHYTAEQSVIFFF